MTREIKFRAWNEIKKYWTVLELLQGGNFFPSIKEEDIKAEI